MEKYKLIDDSSVLVLDQTGLTKKNKQHLSKNIYDIPHTDRYIDFIKFKLLYASFKGNSMSCIHKSLE